MKPILLAPLLFVAACSHTGIYALSDRIPADQSMTFNGIVLSVEETVIFCWRRTVGCCLSTLATPTQRLSWAIE